MKKRRRLPRSKRRARLNPNSDYVCMDGKNPDRGKVACYCIFVRHCNRIREVSRARFA